MERDGRTYWLRRAAREGKAPRRGRPAPRAGALILTLGLFSFFLATGSFFAFTAAAATATAAWYDTFVSDFPSVATVNTRDVFKTTRILDRNGDLLYELYDQDEGKRTVKRDPGQEAEGSGSGGRAVRQLQQAADPRVVCQRDLLWKSVVRRRHGLQDVLQQAGPAPNPRRGSLPGRPRAGARVL